MTFNKPYKHLIVLFVDFKVLLKTLKWLQCTSECHFTLQSYEYK